MSLGQGANQSGLNVAVSGAKIAWVLIVHAFPFSVFPNSNIHNAIVYPHTDQSHNRPGNWLTPWNQTLWVCHPTIQPSKHWFLFFLFFFYFFPPPNVTKCRVFLALISSDAEFPGGLEAGDPFHRRQWPVSVLQRQSELLREVVTGTLPHSVRSRAASTKRQWTLANTTTTTTTTARRVVWRLVHRTASWYHLGRIVKLCERPSPLIALLCPTWMRHAFPFNEHILPLQPPSCLPSRLRLAVNERTAHSDRPCSGRGINNSLPSPRFPPRSFSYLFGSCGVFKVRCHLMHSAVLCSG